MAASFERRFRSVAHLGLRIAAGLAFFSHGAQKTFGWFGGFGSEGDTAPIMSWFGAAGLIETVAGACIVVGLFARPLALLASGEMAVAYFWRHWARSGDAWWWQNHGELALLYAFIWLLIAAWGPGAFSLDGWLGKRRTSTRQGQNSAAST